MLIEEDRIDLSRDRQLRLELPDPPSCRSELDCLVGAQPFELAAIDLVLLEPAIDRRFADRERHRELSHTRASASELQDLTTDLSRIFTRQFSESSEDRTTLETDSANSGADQIARHRRAPAGAGQTLQSAEHARLLERAVLDTFTTDKPCRRKTNRPPGNDALAEAARLRGHTADGIVVDLENYARIAKVAR